MTSNSDRLSAVDSKGPESKVGVEPSEKCKEAMEKSGEPNAAHTHTEGQQQEEGSSSSSAGSTKELVQQEEARDVDTATGCCQGTSAWMMLLRLTLCILAGIIFGWSLEKTRVFEPASIRLQMVFERWIMLKMFLAAVATGQLILCILSVLPRTKEMFNHSLQAFEATFSDKGIVTSCLGPFTLGVGMTLSGACPGMVLAQVGAWSKNAIWTFVGTLIGALLYGMVAPWIVRVTRPKKSYAVQTAHETFKVPYVAMALPMCLLLGVTVFLMEWFINWEEDLDCWNRNSLVSNTTNPFAYKSWPPWSGGVLIGLLQFIVVLSVKDTIGGSSAYMTLVSQWVVTEKLQQLFPYLARARCGLANWWQVMYVLAAVLGGVLSALSSDSLGTSQGVSIASAICGGVLLLLGARLGAGCTSGHGLSGMALLMWLSFIAVPMMFAGAIAVGFAMKASEALYDFHCHSSDQHCYDIPTENCESWSW